MPGQKWAKKLVGVIRSVGVLGLEVTSSGFKKLRKIAHDVEKPEAGEPVEVALGEREPAI